MASYVLKDWKIIRQPDSKWSLIGKVSDDSRFSDGEFVRTSLITSLDIQMGVLLITTMNSSYQCAYEDFCGDTIDFIYDTNLVKDSLLSSLLQLRLEKHLK